MAVPYVGHLAARLKARFHVQVEFSHMSVNLSTPATVPIKGRVVRVFRRWGTLRVGDEVMFSVHVCRSGDDIWPGPDFMLYEDFIQTNYLEVYLNGNPPKCEVALDECVAIDRPTHRPQLRSSLLAYLVELVKWKLY
jgi:hypothetical protein